jgi:hypothetical protein
MIDKLTPALVALAAAALALGLAMGGLWASVVAAVIVAGLWLAGLWQRWTWTSEAGFAVYIVAAAVGLLAGAEAGWVLPGLGMALAAWDLDGFSRRMDSADRIVNRADLERRHLVRLLAIELAGMVLAATALVARIQPGFGLLLLLGVLAAVGLSQVIAMLSREGRPRS